MLLAYCKQIIQNQRKITSWSSSYYQRVLTEKLLRIFPVAITHAKVAISGSGKMVIACYHICYFFQKRAALSLTLLEN